MSDPTDDQKPCVATPGATLEQRIMHAAIPKSEAEWWARREIMRLRAGGCARDQKATQYCAEAAKLADENAELRARLDATKRELHDALEMFALRTDDIMEVNRELERVKVALANAMSERDKLREAANVR